MFLRYLEKYFERVKTMVLSKWHARAQVNIKKKKKIEFFTLIRLSSIIK